MKSLILSLTTLLLPSLALAGEIDFYSGGGCSGGGENVNAPPNTGIVSCGEVPGYASARVQSVDGGCSFTVYTDSTCSVDATTAGLGQCVGGATIYSYSYDCS